MRSFPGATTQCKDNYVKLSTRAPPGYFSLHIGMNDLISNATSNEIIKKIVEEIVEI